MYYVYILRSQKDKRHYIGCTENIERRLEEHNAGKNKSTKNRKPFIVIHIEKFDTLTKARERERKIKSYKGGNEFKKLISNQQ